MRTLAIILILTTSVLPNLAQANARLESVFLQTVAVDASAHCNRTFYESSQFYKNTVFFMPRIVPGPGPDGKRLYDFVPTGNGKFMLYLRLFFPVDDDVLKVRAASQAKADPNACNLDVVKYLINKPRAEQDKIATIDHIPLTSIEVHLPGIKAMGRIGNSVTVLEYFGQTVTAIFNDISQEEKEYFEYYLATADGLPAKIQPMFNAKHRAASVIGRVNGNSLKEKFLAQISADRKMIAKAEATAKLTKAFEEKMITVIQEGGTSSAAAGITKMILDKLFKEVSLATTAETSLPDPSASGDEMISVKGVLDIIDQQTKGEIRYEEVGSEIAIPEVELALRNIRQRDERIQEVPVRAQYIDPAAGIALREGYSIKIQAAYTYLDKISYVQVSSYLTSKQLEGLNLAAQFPDLSNPGMTTEDTDKPGLGIYAQGTFTPFHGYSPLSYMTEYRWKRTMTIPQREQQGSHRIEPTLAALCELPVMVSFSEMGNLMIPFCELENYPEDLRVEFKKGRLIITALRDLGVMRFRESMPQSDYAVAGANTVLEYVEQEEWPTWGQPAVTKRYDIPGATDSDALTKQRTYVFLVWRPEKLPIASATKPAVLEQNYNLVIPQQ